MKQSKWQKRYHALGITAEVFFMSADRSRQEPIRLWEGMDKHDKGDALYDTKSKLKLESLYIKS